MQAGQESDPAEARPERCEPPPGSPAPLRAPAFSPVRTAARRPKPPPDMPSAPQPRRLAPQSLRGRPAQPLPAGCSPRSGGAGRPVRAAPARAVAPADSGRGPGLGFAPRIPQPTGARRDREAARVHLGAQELAAASPTPSVAHPGGWRAKSRWLRGRRPRPSCHCRPGARWAPRDPSPHRGSGSHKLSFEGPGIPPCVVPSPTREGRLSSATGTFIALGAIFFPPSRQSLHWDFWISALKHFRRYFCTVPKSGNAEEWK